MQIDAKHKDAVEHALLKKRVQCFLSFQTQRLTEKQVIAEAYRGGHYAGHVIGFEWSGRGKERTLETLRVELGDGSKVWLKPLGLEPRPCASMVGVYYYGKTVGLSEFINRMIEKTQVAT